MKTWLEKVNEKRDQQSDIGPIDSDDKRKEFDEIEQEIANLQKPTEETD